MVNHSSILAGKISWTKEPGGLQFMNRKEWGMTERLSSVQFSCSVVSDSGPWTTACQASLSITNSQSLPKLMSIESVMPSMVSWTERLTQVNIGYLVSEGRNFHSIYSMEVLHMFVCPGKIIHCILLKKKKKLSLSY